MPNLHRINLNIESNSGQRLDDLNRAGTQSNGTAGDLTAEFAYLAEARA